MTERNATIVYSGGDDVFIVGAWNEVIELSIDLQEKFKNTRKEPCQYRLELEFMNVHIR